MKTRGAIMSDDSKSILVLIFHDRFLYILFRKQIYAALIVPLRKKPCQIKVENFKQV